MVSASTFDFAILLSKPSASCHPWFFSHALLAALLHRVSASTCSGYAAERTRCKLPSVARPDRARPPVCDFAVVEVEGLQPSSPNGAFRRQGHTGGKSNERRLRLQNKEVEDVEAFLHS